jgi:hypothetical protein
MCTKISKNFEGRWISNTTVYFTSLETKITVEEFQIVELEIKKIDDQIYLCTFTQIYPPITGSVINSNQFNCVAVQSTENKLLLQSGTDGLNTFYFKNEPKCKEEEEVLFTTLSKSITTNSKVNGFLSGVQKYNRI